MSQLSFTWPATASYAPEDFIVSDANAQAVHFLSSWPDGSSATAVISGPQSCGKTHLAMNWARRVSGCIIDNHSLGAVDSAALWQGGKHAVLENIETITDETALFHLLRHAESQGLFLLCTARVNAGLLFKMNDLRSRFRAMPHTVIHAPDEELLRKFLYKCFSDRQLRVSQEVTDYLLNHMERSFHGTYAAVEAIEKAVLTTKRAITIPLVKSLMI